MAEKPGKMEGGAVRPRAGGERGPATAASRLLAGFYLRFHISLLLLWSFSAGFLVTKGLLWAGVHSMLWRYPLALLASYGAFFLGVRIWLAYVGADPLVRPRSSLVDGAGNGGGFDPGSWGGRGGGSGPALKGGGGDFGGGGASSSFAADSAVIGETGGGSGPVQAPAAGWFSGGSGGGKGGGGGGGSGIDLDLGDGDGWLVVLLLVLIAALLTSLFGAVLYLVYSAPAVLADVAFQAMLAGGMVKSSQRWRDASWERSLLKSTWIPFVIVFLLAVGTAALAVRLFPAAHTLPEVIHAAWGFLG